LARRSNKAGMVMRRFVAMCVAAAALPIAACGNRPDPVKRYELSGQVLAVHTNGQELTIKHEDIPAYMPGMTMKFPVVASSLMVGRRPGELITATLEVDGLVGKLTAITHKGDAPLPESTNEVAMAEGILEVGDVMPDAALIDQTDRRRSLSEWRGAATLVTFIYTRCPLPNYCPLMDRNFVTIQRSLADDPALAGKLKLISVSFDPVFDTPAVLAAHARTLQADTTSWTFLTGDKVTVDRLAAKFGVGVIRGPDGATEITHNLRTGLFAADGTLITMYPGSDWTPRAVLTDLRAHLSR
jgi:protein SCO1/2